MSLQYPASEMLPLMEHFYTIQGEGAYSGVPAYFIRLGGCDVGCVWCDVKESWDADAHPKVSVAEMLTFINGTPAQIVVVTGGEPLMYDLSVLTSELKKAGLRTHIETSGAHPLSGHWDWICFSPKKFKKPVEGFAEHAHELKVIVYNRSDFHFAESHASEVKAQCQLFLQPEWGKSEEVLPLIIEYVKANPRWRISLQTHKFLGIP